MDVISITKTIVLKEFGIRLMSLFVIGSRASDDFFEDSDIDTVAVLRFSIFHRDYKAKVRACNAVFKITGLKLDINLRGSVELFNMGCEYIKFGSRLLVGEDITSQVPTPELFFYCTKTLNAAIRSFAQLYGEDVKERFFYDSFQIEPSVTYQSYLGDQTRIHAKVVLGHLANICRTLLAYEFSIYIAFKTTAIIEYSNRCPSQEKGFEKIDAFLRCTLAQQDRVIWNTYPDIIKNQVSCLMELDKHLAKYVHKKKLDIKLHSISKSLSSNRNGNDR